MAGRNQGVDEKDLHLGLCLDVGTQQEDVVELLQHLRRRWAVQGGDAMLDAWWQVDGLGLGPDHGGCGHARVVQVLE
jgi:hypothetical protein